MMAKPPTIHDTDAEIISECLIALRALLGLYMPPAGEPGHVDYGTAVGLAALAMARAELRLGIARTEAK